MFIFYKYKNNTTLNNNYCIEFEKTIKKFNYLIKYFFNYKFKILKNFLYFYFIFLVFSPFSVYQLKNNLNFKINFNYNSIIFLDEEYSNFFLCYGL